MASKDPLLPVSPEIPSYSQIACIGTGLSAVALGATLQRWYGLDDIRFFDRHPVSGGTWYINSYPGCGCDVPSALYSYSFELNANWTKMLPSNQEIKQYHECVMDMYHLREKMVLSTEVTQCVWRDDAARWLLYLRDVKTGREFTHECQILFAASGQLVKPRRCEIPGSEEFRGAIFHSARWDHSVSLDGKKMIVIGNGCTAAQIVPAIAGKVKSLTQIIRSKHWVSPTHNFAYPPVLQWIFRYIPFTMRLHRLHIFLAAESDYFLFPMTKAAARWRAQRKIKLERYMRASAPAKYHDLLIPDFDVGCKRRIIDCGYLDSLHNDKITLTNVEIVKIVPEGIQTKQGDIIPADVIVLATGFETNTFAPYMNIVGRNRASLSEHWAQYGGPSAYNCSVMSGFPNFFLLLGPNAATGHTSALMAAENSINYALRILKPVLSGSASAVEVKQEAERSYVYWVQGALRKRVWNAGCVSWYLNESKWNSMSYPWTQAHFWWRSLFPTWSDWHIRVRGPSNTRSFPFIKFD
ncbi:flavin-containing monooxygenase [Aspergillus brunneoviolaceus CBS 621.78]|uniref:Monooxygenase n=1 Tax=Aspergillus brunneoviolaceus CBS 621.78 TaxID=1450534 RepID=A0ACD1GEM1_9EURO|nr:monooxygenase [Aspergillus brunneoviolaceus CBS 621.78]RAH47698.1 monooxygenase [Aspergillus brunneoviolaceus CBS 621.78]